MTPQAIGLLPPPGVPGRRLTTGVSAGGSSMPAFSPSPREFEAQRCCECHMATSHPFRSRRPASKSDDEDDRFVSLGPLESTRRGQGLVGLKDVRRPPTVPRFCNSFVRESSREPRHQCPCCNARRPTRTRRCWPVFRPKEAFCSTSIITASPGCASRRADHQQCNRRTMPSLRQRSSM